MEYCEGMCGRTKMYMLASRVFDCTESTLRVLMMATSARHAQAGKIKPCERSEKVVYCQVEAIAGLGRRFYRRREVQERGESVHFTK